jgi:hypothetical protein
VSERRFTREEVNRLIPELMRLMGRAMERHRLAAGLRAELEAEQERLRLAGGGLVDRAAWRARAERLEELQADVRRALQDILSLGGVTKDLDLGLVDFPGVVPSAGGDVVANLCWKYGETAVAFWHGFDEGYANRKPLP